MKLEQVSNPGGPTPADAGYRFTDPKPLAGAVIIWMWIYVAAAALNVAGVWLEVRGLSAMSPTTPLSDDLSLTGDPTLDLVSGLTRLLSLGLYVVSGFLFLKWTYRVVKNARVMSGGRMNAKPGWAIGWYFVPIAFLWKPVQYLRETWRVSFSPGSPGAVEVPGMFGLWWACWLVSALSGNIAGRLGMTAQDAGTYLASDVLEIVSDVMIIPAAFFLVRIVRALSDQQFDNRDLSVFD